jgi:signal transduction histidine kinase
MSDSSDSYLLFVFSPLFPVGSTINILKIMLIYVTIIAILLALLLSLYLSTRISRPIKAITASAAKMGTGDYSVKFQHSSYSEINELSDTLTQAQTELERTDMYQKDLIANVSHDLRTPLTMIKSYAEMIRDLSGNNPEKRNKHLGVIIDETDRLNDLVNDMLNLSKMQSHKIVLERKPFDISEAAASIMASYNILQDNEGYDIQFTNMTEPCIVDGDENKLKQVMINLVNNAVKYCGEDKVILVSLMRYGRKVRFSVTDHGQGIAPEELPHVWERYYKSSTHHVRATEGSGLGLSIVKEILCLHKAEFDVESTVGRGSTFWFELPLEKRR